MSISQPESDAIRSGVHDAIIEIVELYPLTRQDALEAISAGVRLAVAEYLADHGLDGFGGSGR